MKSSLSLILSVCLLLTLDVAYSTSLSLESVSLAERVESAGGRQKASSKSCCEPYVDSLKQDQSEKKHLLIAALHFYYGAFALPAMQTAVIARPILSVRPPVCPSRSGVMSRGIKIRSWGFQHQGGQSF